MGGDQEPLKSKCEHDRNKQSLGETGKWGGGGYRANYRAVCLKSLRMKWPGEGRETPRKERERVDIGKQKQSRNKLQMENAVALRQNPVDFGSQGSWAFQLQLLFAYPPMWTGPGGFAAEAMETAG